MSSRKTKRAETVPPAPVKVQRLYKAGTEALLAAIGASEDVQQFIDDAVGWAIAARALEPDSTAEQEALDRSHGAALAATLLLLKDDDVCHYFGEQVLPNVAEIVMSRVAGGRLLVSWPGGVRRASLLPGQRSRYELLGGQRALVTNGAKPAEIRALRDYMLWESERASGEPAKLRGKTNGAGRMLPSKFYQQLEAGLKACRSSQLTLQLLAGQTGLDRGTLSDYLDDPDYGPPWKLLKAQRTLVKCEAAGWKRPAY